MADVISEETRGKTFRDIEGLSPWIVKQIDNLKIEKPTPIQYHCIPEALKGKDIIGAAKTGSGKTLSFVIPVLQKLSLDPYGIFCLVLTPTRELASQIADHFRVLGKAINLRLNLSIGGLDKVSQGGELSKRPHVVIATPGRMADILETTPDFTLKRIKFLVLDEADRLMDGRFHRQLKIIFEALPPKRQTLLFSATMTQSIQKMLELAKSDVFIWQSSSAQATVEQLKEHYSLVNPVVKDTTLVVHLMKFQEENPKALIIIFTDTCKNAQLLHMVLTDLGMESVTLHSMIKQTERLATISRFKSSQTKILVATDLASRGLDIPRCELVINHSIPNEATIYIHRVGRTARAGRVGTSITLITPDEISLLLAIEDETKRKMTEYKVDEYVVRRIMKQVNVSKRVQMIKLDEMNFDEKKIINKRKKLLMKGIDPDEFEEKKELQKRKRRRKFQNN